MSIIKCPKCGEEYDSMYSFHSCGKPKKEKIKKDFLKRYEVGYWDFVKRDWWWLGLLMLVKIFNSGLEWDVFIVMLIAVIPIFLSVEWIRYKFC